jgi:hypothetical protein
LDNYDHSRYPTELGIPEMLAFLEDTIFEGLKNGKAQEWPEQFLEAIRPGADLSRVGWKFIHWLLTESKIGAYDHELVSDAVQQCAAVIEPLTRGEKADVSAARSAESAARSAARSAANSANAANAVSAARSASWSAANSSNAANAACSAANAVSAACSAANAEGAEGAAWSAASAERSAAYEKMAAHLLTLLREAN